MKNREGLSRVVGQVSVGYQGMVAPSARSSFSDSYSCHMNDIWWT